MTPFPCVWSVRNAQSAWLIRSRRQASSETEQRWWDAAAVGRKKGRYRIAEIPSPATSKVAAPERKTDLVQLIPRFINRRISHRPNLVKIVDNIGWLFFDKVLRMGVGLFVGVWIARYLGPEQYGLLNFAVAFAGLFGAIAGLGLKEIVVRDVVRDPDHARLTLGTAALMQLIGGLAAFMAMLVAISFVRPDDALARSIVAVLGSIMMLKFSEIAVYWFESQVRSKYTVWVQNGTFLVFAVIRVLLILQQAPLIAFAWAMLVEAVVAAIILVIVLGRKGPSLSHLSASMARARALLADSWPLVLSAIAVTVYMRIDQIMLGQMVSDEAVGIYSAAVRLSEIWYLVPTIVVATVFPALAVSHQQNPPQFYERLQKLYGGLVKTALAISLVISLVSEELVALIFGDEYLGSADVLTWHIWGGVFVFFGVAWYRWIILEGLQKIAVKIHLLSLVANVVLNLVLIPIYGVIGAAVATTISYALGHTVFMLFFPSQRRAVTMFWAALK